MKLCENSELKQTICCDLVEQARGGDAKSMEKLASLVRENIYPYLYHVTLNHDLSEDLSQETLVEMICYLPSLSRTRSFWPWIRKIAFHKIVDCFRYQRSRASAISTWHETYRIHQRQKNRDTLEVLIFKEELTDTTVALRHLSKQYRDVIRLRCLKQMNYVEIANTLQCTPVHARVTFNRAKKALRNHLPATRPGRGRFEQKYQRLQDG